MLRETMAWSPSRFVALVMITLGAACGGSPPAEGPAAEGPAATARPAPGRNVAAPPELVGLDANFGRTLALSGDELAVASWLQTESTVFLYRRCVIGWCEYQRIAGSSLFFGMSLAFDTRTLVIGESSAERVHVYRRHHNRFVLEATLEGPDTAGAGFGEAVVLDRGTLYVGAPAVTEGGVIHVYQRDGLGGAWRWVDRITSPWRAVGDLFGAPLAISGDVLVTTTRGTTPPEVVTFRRGSGGWEEEARLREPEDEGNYSFGRRIALAGGVLVVNCDCGDGEVYVFEWDGQGWRLVTTLAGAAGTMTFFGHEFALGDGQLVVTSPWADDGVSDSLGSATLYQRTQVGWEAVARLAPPALAAPVAFGHAVAVQGRVAVVGAPGVGETTGRVYTYALRVRGD